MRNLLCLISLVLLLSPLSAQDLRPDTTRSVEREILSYRDTEGELVTSSRRMLLDRVRSGDATKVSEILDFLHERIDATRRLALWPGEEFLLSFWGHRYRPLLNPARLDMLDTLSFERFLLPPRDMLFSDLQEYTRSHRTAVRAGILAATLEPEEAAFLRIFLDDLILDRSDTTGRRLLNEDADEFLAQYKGSRYAGFVRRQIRIVYRESAWGYGFDIGLGTGFVGGAMAQYFPDHLALTLGFDLGRRAFLGTLDGVLYARFSLGASPKLKTPFVYGGTWQQDLKVDLIIPELTLGVVALDNSFLQVTPFGGISGILIGPSEQERKDRNNDDVSLDMFSWTVGLNLDWKVSKGESVITSGTEHAYWFIRSRVSFNAPFSPPESRFGGNIVTLTLSFGGFGRPVGRDL